ncbi:MAG: LLM class flavin-dependent oxidoreductase [Chloroflexi bacterium]|nr:LLM class flavin-dependent oxidoreductase [Chloroflexota bacterium]
MEFGLQFFPDVGPEEKSGQQYWNECLDLAGLCDELGFTQVRTVEHYFEPYGGYSPSPHIFLTAASQRTSKARLLTGAVLPVFNHPLKIAGEIGMLDAISNGRLDCGFGRAFLPHEFQRFDRTMDESRARFDEGVEAVRRLLEEENVTFDGEFHRFKNVTSLPRPTQKPRPPFWVAALGTPESMQAAGRNGYNLMLVPFAGPKMREAIGIYRDAWRQAGHPGEGKIALGFHMFCHQDREEAHRVAKPNVNAYFRSLVAAAERDSGWGAGASSRDYPGYDGYLDILRAANFDSLLNGGTIWVGTPEDIRQQIRGYAQEVGGFHTASLQVNFHLVPAADAAASMRLFAQKVISTF